MPTFPWQNVVDRGADPAGVADSSAARNGMLFVVRHAPAGVAFRAGANRYHSKLAISVLACQ